MSPNYIQLNKAPRRTRGERTRLAFGPCCWRAARYEAGFENPTSAKRLEISFQLVLPLLQNIQCLR
ncbi:hypothetical protein DPMN_027550 [Dreissena polymorpha]|uniref:Uncharacterized protein n=1 Tax=Dreissena polymorpha TaxID=45954 RepID=A0A9D4LT65_DREPO|nr:hypothetical protein DPMN_027550 [Dreissena polymorpha]